VFTSADRARAEISDAPDSPGSSPASLASLPSTPSLASDRSSVAFGRTERDGGRSLSGEKR